MTSPFPPEPARRSRVVDAAMWLSRRRAATVLETPHLHGGSDEDKVEYEYASPDSFWHAFGGDPGPSDLDGKRVLDVGCGWGGKAVRYAEQTALTEIHGFDLAGAYDPEAPARFARSRGVTNAHFTTGFAEEIPFAGESFDVAMMDDVLEHVGDPVKTIAECVRVLRPGGLLIVKFPSLRMLRAHHLDRAISLTGAHYLLPLRRWAAGLNSWLERHPGSGAFVPFDEVVDTPYRRGVTRNLSGLDVAGFRAAVTASGLEVIKLEIAPLPLSAETAKGRAARALLGAAGRWERVREVFGEAVVFAGRKPQDARAGAE